MSKSAAGLRSRLDSASDLRSVVRTMKSLAASSIGQYQKSVHALADYYHTVELGLGACLRVERPKAVRGERLARDKSAVVDAVVFGSDQGLVGQFNDIVADNAVEALASRAGHARVWAVGTRVHSRLAQAGLEPAGAFEVPSSVDGVALLVEQILVKTQAGNDRLAATELHLFYNHASGSGASF
ncbi:MAG: F0F1 ATP synthase subunit gamma, partial [Polyangiales bacterium]